MNIYFISPTEIREGDTLINPDGTVEWVARSDAYNYCGADWHTEVKVQLCDGHGPLCWKFYPRDILDEVRFAVTDTPNGRTLTV